MKTKRVSVRNKAKRKSQVLRVKKLCVVEPCGKQGSADKRKTAYHRIKAHSSIYSYILIYKAVESGSI